MTIDVITLCWAIIQVHGSGEQHTHACESHVQEAMSLVELRLLRDTETVPLICQLLPTYIMCDHYTYASLNNVDKHCVVGSSGDVGGGGGGCGGVYLGLNQC